MDSLSKLWYRQALCSGGVNENSPTGSCLNTLIGGTVWEGVGGVVLLEEICHWGMGFEVSKYSHLPRCLCLLLMD